MMSDEAEMTADKLKEKLVNWFSEKENKQTLRAFLRSLILNKLSNEDLQLDLKFKNVIFDNIDIAILYFVCDYLAQNHFHYSLSVFSSEISSTKLHEYVCDYFSKISYKWNPRKPPMLEYYTVHNILLSLNINPSGRAGSEIVNSYYLLGEGSLLKVVASAMKRLNDDSDEVEPNHDFTQKESSGESLPLQLNGSYHNNTHMPSDGQKYAKVPFEEIEKYLYKKYQQIQRRISSQKQEFSRCRRILLSCHDALNVKLNQIHDLMAHLNSQKNKIFSQLEAIQNYHSKEQLSVPENQKTHYEQVERVDKAVWAGDTKTLQNSVTQTKIVGTADKCVETVVKEVSWQHNCTQTETGMEIDNDMQYQLEQEKTELLQYIDQQQDRIKSLTNKTMELMNKICSHRIPEMIGFVDRGTSCGENNTIEESEINLQEVINRSDKVIEKLNFHLKSIKLKSLEAGESYSHFLDDLLYN